MSSYYTPPSQVFDGAIAFADDVNDINNETAVAFDLVEADIATLADASSGYALIAKNWAVGPGEDPNVPVEPGLYASKYYALEAGTQAGLSNDSAVASAASAGTSSDNMGYAYDWANAGYNVAVSNPGGSGFSAFHWSEVARLFAESALGSNTISAGTGIGVTATGTDPVDFEVYFNGDKTTVGLGNVDNTADLSKPISTLQQAAIDARVASPVNTITDLGTITTSTVINGINYDAYVLTAGVGASILFTGMPIGKCITLIVRSGDSGLTWDSAVKWPNGEVPSFSAGTDRVVFHKVSVSEIHGSLAGQEYA